MKTLKQAQAWAEMLVRLHKQTHHIIKVDKGAAAYECGIRFATIPDSELEDYIAGGANIVGVVAA